MEDASENSEQARQVQEARKRQLQEMQREMQLREVLRKILDDKAFERISNIRISNKDFYLQLAQLLVYAFERGQIRGRMSEQELLALLNRLKAGEKESSITFKRK